MQYHRFGHPSGQDQKNFPNPRLVENDRSFHAHAVFSRIDINTVYPGIISFVCHKPTCLGKGRRYDNKNSLQQACSAARGAWGTNTYTNLPKTYNIYYEALLVLGGQLYWITIGLLLIAID